MKTDSISIDETRLPVYISRSRQSTEANKTGSWRVMCPEYEEKTSPCSLACPAGEDIARIQMLTTQELFKDAWETILMENPFPSVCGRVCYHPCEGVCNRQYFDEPIDIHTIECFLGDTADRYQFKPSFQISEPRSENVAIVGAGPSSLSVAYFLSRLGYNCDVFEEKPEPGGVLRWCIPTYRLPDTVLEREIGLIRDMGVTIHCGQHVSRSFLEEIRGNYDALFFGCGHGRIQKLEIPGEDQVMNGLTFLSGVKAGKTTELKGTIAILGGGNTAIDVARCVIRLGGKALIIYRRRKQDMPAFAGEVEMALAEGAELWELLSPGKIEKEKEKYILTLQKMEMTGLDELGNAVVKPDPGKVRSISVQMVVKAIGADAVESWQSPPQNGANTLRLSNCIMSFETSGFAQVFGGDLVAEIKSVVHAVASGKHAAIALDLFFREGREAIAEGFHKCAVGEGPPVSMKAYLNKGERLRSPGIVSFESINTDYFKITPRLIQPRLLMKERISGFAEIDLRVSAGLSMRESERCFNCGICNQCDNCYIFCPEIAVVRDTSLQGRHINYDYCKGCGLCVVECPRNAMVLKEEQP